MPYRANKATLLFSKQRMSHANKRVIAFGRTRVKPHKFSVIAPPWEYQLFQPNCQREILQRQIGTANSLLAPQPQYITVSLACVLHELALYFSY